MLERREREREREERYGVREGDRGAVEREK